MEGKTLNYTNKDKKELRKNFEGKGTNAISESFSQIDKAEHLREYAKQIGAKTDVNDSYYVQNNTYALLCKRNQYGYTSVTIYKVNGKHDHQLFKGFAYNKNASDNVMFQRSDDGIGIEDFYTQDNMADQEFDEIKNIINQINNDQEKTSIDGTKIIKK